MFINGSFINNKNLSNQIKFIIVIDIETIVNLKFLLRSNIIYISLIKYKRIIRIIFAFKLYIIIIDIDIFIFISFFIVIIINKLNLLRLRIIVYINFFSLYEYIVKFNTIKEKYLMINIIIIRKSYERREFTEIQ